MTAAEVSYNFSPDLNELRVFFCDRISEKIGRTQRKKVRAVIFLAGGKTPAAFYSALAERSLSDRSVNWNDIDFFLGDERDVPPDSEESNYRMAVNALCAAGSEIRRENVFRVRTGDFSPRESASIYESDILKATGGSGMPDILILGIGSDCHTASLFPETFYYRPQREGEESPDPTAKKIFFSHYVPGLSSIRYSVTPFVIENSPFVILIAAGDGKKKAVESAMKSEADYEEYPARLIFSGNRTAKNVLVITDIPPIKKT